MMILVVCLCVIFDYALFHFVHVFDTIVAYFPQIFSIQLVSFGGDGYWVFRIGWSVVGSVYKLYECVYALCCVNACSVCLPDFMCMCLFISCIIQYTT